MFDMASSDFFSFSDSVYTEDQGCCPACNCPEDPSEVIDPYRSEEDTSFSWEDILKIASVLEDGGRECPNCDDEPGKAAKGKTK